MPPLAALPVSRGESPRSRQLLSDSRRRLASARELIAQSWQSMARQSYVRIVCAWCQTTIRFERSPVAARGQVSHSICYECFAPVFQELVPGHASPPVPPWRRRAARTPQQLRITTRPGGHLREEARRAGATDPVTGLPTP